MSEHAKLRELLPLYALGALEGTDECDLVCAHLASGCPECAGELAEHARVAARIPEALAPVAPRPEVRAALEKKLAAAPREASNVVPLRPRGAAAARPGWLWIAIPTAAAAAALIAAVNLNEQVRWHQNEATEKAQELADLSARVGVLQRDLEKDRALADALASGDAQVIALGPAAAGAAGTGHIVWNKKDRTWTLLASGLKPLGPDEVYELWFVTAPEPDKVRSAIRFQPGPGGIVRQTVAVPADMTINLAAITREPKTNDDPGPSLQNLVLLGKTTG